ncbi:MAG: hypothetical protein Q8P26_03685 [Candidatus Levybacteria bacterium]|nr:hypothetical protein [Candidatus Levybacteria bacterium]
MNWIIAILVIFSYYIASKAILKNKYHPSIFSRFIWLLLAVNNFASVVALKSNDTIILLAGLALLGSLAIFFLSLRKAKRRFDKTELISTVLLVVSLAVWIFADLPLVNLTIGLAAHFIGGIPTYKKALKDPKDEYILFWLFFSIASLFTFVSTDKTLISDYLYPLYFVLFDGSIVLLCLRRYTK